MRLQVTIPGVPVPQGSKMPWGGEANPHVRAWRETVARAARELMPDGPWPGPVSVKVTFVFPRPKAHFRSGKYAHEVKLTAPKWHTSTPDLDKLQRALGDAFKGVVLRDDSQVAVWEVQKLYGLQPCAQVEVTTLTEEEPDGYHDQG